MTGTIKTDEAGQPGLPGVVLSSDGLGAAVRNACPLRISPGKSDGCCRWDTFLGGFAAAWAMRPDKPTAEQWQAAKRDWRAGNTGWEAAQNAKAREAEAVAKAARKPLVWLGGKNYAEAGSALAIKYGRPKSGD